MRRRSRECALQILYQLDLAGNLGGKEPPRGNTVDEALNAFWLFFEASGEGAAERPPVDRELCERLVRGVAADCAAIDAGITAASQRWRIERMPLVDRNLLRVAAYEIERCPDIPAGVSINEAIEIAKRFSGQEAASFVNGVLDAIARKNGRTTKGEEAEP
jgi:transcription antitermination protein NusB